MKTQSEVFVVLVVVVLHATALSLGKELPALSAGELHAAQALTTPALLQAARARTEQRLRESQATTAGMRRQLQALLATTAAAQQQGNLTLTDVQTVQRISQHHHLHMAAVAEHMQNQRARERSRAARHAQHQHEATGLLLRRRWQVLIQLKRSRRSVQSADRAALQQVQAQAASVQAVQDEAQTLRDLTRDTQRVTHTILAATTAAEGDSDNAVLFNNWRRRLAQLFPANQTDDTSVHEDAAADAAVERDAASQHDEAFRWMSLERPWSRTLALAVLHAAVCLITSLPRLRLTFISFIYLLTTKSQ